MAGQLNTISNWRDLLPEHEIRFWKDLGSGQFTNRHITVGVDLPGSNVGVLLYENGQTSWTNTQDLEAAISLAINMGQTAINQGYTPVQAILQKAEQLDALASLGMVQRAPTAPAPPIQAPPQTPTGSGGGSGSGGGGGGSTTVPPVNVPPKDPPKDPPKEEPTEDPVTEDSDSSTDAPPDDSAPALAYFLGGVAIGVILWVLNRLRLGK